ncbi:MAG: NUDIX domain-containing protein, partial [Acidimicrobiia bacterium]
MPGEHRTISSESIFRGRIFEVLVEEVELPSGDRAYREFVKHPGAVAVVALQEETEEKTVLLVEQMRHPVGEKLLEIPAGKLDKPGEEPQACAARELEEETGFRATSLTLIASYYSTPGFTNERMTIFLAEQLERVGDPPEADEGEPIALSKIPIEKAVELIRQGAISDSKTIVGILMAIQHLEHQKSHDSG